MTNEATTGPRVRFVRSAGEYPLNAVRKGETGTLVELSAERVSIRLDSVHADLAEWGNCLHFSSDLYNGKHVEEFIECCDFTAADYKTDAIDELVAALRGLAEYVGGSDTSADHPAGRAWQLLEEYETPADPNDCPECARANGPHYSGPCEH